MTDSFAPVAYALIGALVLLFVLQVWQSLRRRRQSPDKDYSLDAHLIDGTPHLTPHREWLWEKLTTREMEVARLVVEGKRNADIAQALSISVRTVESHIQKIYSKLDVHSRTELARVIRDLVD